MLAHGLPGKEVLPYLNDWDYTWKVICNFSSLSLFLIIIMSLLPIFDSFFYPVASFFPLYLFMGPY